MKNIGMVVVVLLLTSCDGGPIQNAATQVVGADGGMGGGGNVGNVPFGSQQGGVDGGSPDVRMGMVQRDGGDLVDVDATSPEAIDAVSLDVANPRDVADVPDVWGLDGLALDKATGDVVSDVPPDGGMSTQIFPGLCCGAPGTPCQSTVTTGACCPSSMTATECQAMWGTEAWCYCPTEIGLDCFRWQTGANMPLDLQWQCAHGPQGAP